MENKDNDTKSSDSAGKRELGLPILAFVLSLLPFFFMFLSMWIRIYSLSSYMSLASLLAPICGVIIGVRALSFGKERIGIIGQILSIIAITIPLSIVGFVLVFFIGVSTGIISIM